MEVIVHSIYVEEEFSSVEGWQSVNTNIRAWVPSKPDDFAISLVLSLGQKGRSKNSGSDNFGLLVATPLALSSFSNENTIIADRPLLVLRTYDRQLIWDNIAEKVNRCYGSTWNQCGVWLSRYFSWEFDGYEIH